MRRTIEADPTGPAPRYREHSPGSASANYLSALPKSRHLADETNLLRSSAVASKVIAPVAVPMRAMSGRRS